jgi:hypothetical protein
MSTPTPDENQPMREALQRDAAGVPKPDFNPAQHYATMRRIRGLPETPRRQFGLWPMLAVATAVLMLTAAFAFWQMRPPHRNRVASQTLLPQEHPLVAMPRTSLLTYQMAASQGEDALSALLDRDARDLLPASPSVFQAPFN